MKIIRIILILCSLCWVSSARADLNTLDTEHYRIHTDLDRPLAEDLGRRMEAMYAQYSTRLSAFSVAGVPKFEVFIFQHHQDYEQLVGDHFDNTGGIFIARRNILAAFLEGQGRDGLRRTLQHEAFHQFAYTAIGPNLPVWLNEGLAQIFEEGIWTGKNFEIGEVPPRRLRQLEYDLRERRFVPFKDFLSMSDEQWQHDLADAGAAATHYNQAWAMTHFLIFATGESGQPKYRTRLINMLKLLHDGESADNAFERAFSDNYDGFQHRFFEFTNSLQPTPEALFMERQSVLADLLMGCAQHGKQFDDMDAFRKFLISSGYRVHYTKGAVQWNSSEDPTVYFVDLSGEPMLRDQLYFSFRTGAPLPDIVSEPIPSLTFHTIFHQADPRPDHETIIESR
jgi:Protein of unknown function (DUF1570)